MSYTNYGLAEGLMMLILPIAIYTLLYITTLYKAPKSYKKRNTLLYVLILAMLALDTLWWVFDIQTGVVDFLVKADSGTEQITIFTIMMFALLSYMILSRPPRTTDTNDES